MAWQLLIFIYIILSVFTVILRRFLSVKLPEHNRLINGFVFLGCIYPLGLIFSSFTTQNLNIGLSNWLYLIAAGTAFAIVNIVSFRASKDVDAGSFSLIANIIPIVTIFTASVLLKERLNYQQIIGAITIISSALIVTIPSFKYRFITHPRGLFLALFSTAMLGLLIVFEKWMLTRIDFGAYLIIGWGMQAVVMAIFAFPERKNIKILFAKDNFAYISMFGASNAIRGLCFLGALFLSGSASVVSASISFTAVVAVVAAYFVLKEKKRFWLKILAAIIGAIGLIILTTA